MGGYELYKAPRLSKFDTLGHEGHVRSLVLFVVVKAVTVSFAVDPRRHVSHPPIHKTWIRGAPRAAF